MENQSGEGNKLDAEEAEIDVKVEDFEAAPRKLSERIDFSLGILMIALSIFQLYTSWAGSFQDMVQRSIHLAFVLPAAIIMYPPFQKSPKKNEIPIIDWIMIVLSVVVTLWASFNYLRIVTNPGIATSIDLIMAPIMIFIVLESTRRILGPVLPGLVLFLMLYAYFGPYLPGDWQHRGFSLEMIFRALYLEMDGIFGYIVGISASTIAGFLIFGVVLSRTGAGETFVDLAKKIAGRSHGGPAKVSCFSSAFFGTISGSAVANVVVDGVFNIPLMKSLGYKKEFAGAVEATTSTGGQIVPPVMGSGIFIMAEILGIPYIKIAAAAVIPAILFYSGCFLGIHFYAQKQNLKPLPAEMIPSFRKRILPRCLPFVIPVSFLIYFLSIGRNPALSVFYTIILALVTYVVLPNPDQSIRLKLNNIIKSLNQGGRSIVMVACLCACAQLVVGMLTATGLGIKISETVINLSGNSVILCLFFTMIVSVVLGMGVITTAAYVLAASVCAPPLIKLGLDPLVAHLFVFYFAIMSAISPPVCSAVFVASAIAKSYWLETGIFALKLGLAGFLVPFMFAYSPGLLLQGDSILIIQNSVTAFLGILCLSSAVMGFLKRSMSLFERTILFIIAFLLINTSLTTDILGGSVFLFMYFSQRAGFSLMDFIKRQRPNAKTYKS